MLRLSDWQGPGPCQPESRVSGLQTDAHGRVPADSAGLAGHGGLTPSAATQFKVQGCRGAVGELTPPHGAGAAGTVPGRPGVAD
jgi:hypothetical protein